MTKAKKLLEMLGQDGEREYAGGTDTCVCLKCGHEIPHKKGVPCNNSKCPNCGEPMTGKETPEIENNPRRTSKFNRKRRIRSLA